MCLACEIFTCHHVLSYIRRLGGGSTDVDGQCARVTRGNDTGCVLIAVGVNVIISKGITLAVDLVQVDQAAVVAGRVGLVVVAAGESRLDIATVRKQGRASKGSAETGNDGQMDIVLIAVLAKGSAVAAPDVGSSRLVVAAVIFVTVEDVVGDLAVDLASGALGVDGERRGRVLAPDLVDVVVPVVAETVAVNDGVVVGRQDAERLTSLVGHTHLAPGVAIASSLVSEAVADGADSARIKALGNLLGSSVGGGQGHAENHANKVDVADVGVDGALRGVSQLDEAPVEARAGILGVGNRGLNEAVSNVSLDHGKGEFAFGEVDAGRVEGHGEGHLEGVAASRESNLDVLGNGLGNAGATRARVDQRAICKDEDDAVGRVLANHVGVHLVAAKVVDKLEREARCSGLVDGTRMNSGVVTVICSVEGVLLGHLHVMNGARRGNGKVTTSSDLDRGGGHGSRHQGGQNCEELHLYRV